MNKYLTSDNTRIQTEYDKLRRKISKILRVLNLLIKSEVPTEHLEKLEKLKSKSEKSDILFDGTLDKLIRNHAITSDMASSLANDSQNVAFISKKLIEAGELIYIHEDTFQNNEVTS